MALFTGMMCGQHCYMVITGRTTVESYRGRDQVEQENRVLQEAYGALWHNQEKSKVRKRWQEEWGGVPLDGRWRWGSAREMWENEMSDKWWEWIRESARPSSPADT